jgi:hypothetical protein
VWTDSWPSIAGAGCSLICVGAGEEWARNVLALQGLRGVERQVGSTQWTQCPGRDQVCAAWWQEKQDEVMNMSWCWVATHNHSLQAGFGWFTPENQHRGGMTVVAKSRVGSAWRLHLVRGVCSSSPQNRQVPWLSHKAKIGGSTGREGILARRDTLKRRTHVGIARLASRLSKVLLPGIHPMVLRREFPKCPSGVCILVLCNRGSFIFHLPPYKLRGERMVATSWDPSSFAFSFSLPIFLMIFHRTSLRASW